MTSKRNPLGGFEERLLGELKSVVAQRKAEQSARQPARAPLWRRPRVVSVASAGALAIGAAIGVPLVGGENVAAPASAAFEITSNDDGTITVTIYRWDDAEGLEEGLEAHGVPAEVDFAPPGKLCQIDRGRMSDHWFGIKIDESLDFDPAGGYELTVHTSAIGPGETLVMEHSSNPAAVGTGISHGMAWQVIEGPVKPCVLEDMPSQGSIAR